MSQAHFAKMPNIAIPRTKMKIPFDHKMSFNFGKIIPIDCYEILPGDTFKVNIAGLIRMSTPISPLLDNIRGSIHAFFVPMRLIWAHTEEFYGANKTTAGPQTTTYTIPSKQYFGVDTASSPVVGSVSDYLGKPIASGNISYGPSVSVLKERAYYLIWNEWYRAEQLQNPVLLDTGDTGGIGTYNGTPLTFATMPFNVTKQFDYFTAMTISPQYGAAVTLPLGAYAPIVAWKDLDGHSGDDADDGYHDITQPGFSNKQELASGSLYGRYLAFRMAGSQNSGTGLWEGASPGNSDYIHTVNTTNLYADLTKATSATINTLRYAFAVQKYLERSNFGGSRFFEMLKVHYGVTSPDARLQRPEHLGEIKFNINIQQVLSTAGYQAGVSTNVGQPGANSVTGIKGHLYRKGFVEPGYVMILLSTYQDHTYCQGVLREDLRQSRYEFYTPEFANLGDQAVLKNELFVASNQNAPTDILGYQEHWAEYRYRPNRVSGLLNPTVSGSLDYWTLADNFAATPTLSPSFIEENRDNISRALSTAGTGPDFIADFYLDTTAVRPMPAYTIPGLIDHFGVR